MHPYDVPRRQSLQPIPSARSAQDVPGGSSATPIYDALYAEYVKSFRTLPGDRSGEEELGFTAFGNIPHGAGTYARHRPGSFSSSYSAYSAGAVSARQQSQWQRAGSAGQQATGLHQLPAALPPGPRGGR
ncbi:hypothetical protein [Streptomyces sediminimaris]|uniref:hypothetical protein n=1 Tax=Streptomyces sediminimaris TaxID=3383721 RepID=UPI0039999249